MCVHLDHVQLFTVCFVFFVAILFSARLRLPSTVSDQEAVERVISCALITRARVILLFSQADAVIKMLELGHLQDVLVGDEEGGKILKRIPL